MHEYRFITFNNIDTVTLSIEVISNYLDYYRTEIILPPSFLVELILEDITTPISYQV